MSQAGPILFVSDAERPAFVAALDEGRLFPVIDTDWASAVRAVEEVQPAAVLAAVSAGKTSGQPGSPVFRSINDTADRVAATVDGSGNRTAVTVTP